MPLVGQRDDRNVQDFCAFVQRDAQCCQSAMTVGQIANRTSVLFFDDKDLKGLGGFEAVDLHTVRNFADMGLQVGVVDADVQTLHHVDLVDLFNRWHPEVARLGAHPTFESAFDGAEHEIEGVLAGRDIGVFEGGDVFCHVLIPMRDLVRRLCLS